MKSKAKAKVMTDLQFITSPLAWPRWPVLPMVRRDGSNQCGLIWADDKPVVIVDANLIGIHEIPGDTWAEKLKGFERKQYPNFDALLKEWRID